MLSVPRARTFALSGLLMATVWLTVPAVSLRGQAPQASADEDVARRQLDSGRSFLRQSNYVEALKDFRAVADTHPATTAAADALLEIARYYLDVEADTGQAATAVDSILKKYPTSDAAPDAYVMAGRLALANSHQQKDLDAAMANFDRVPRLFPASDAVPRALTLSGEALWYAKRLDEALANLMRVEVEYSTTPSAADAHLEAARVLVSTGDPISAMEELQQVRDRWPASPQAAVALNRLTLLHRLYVKAKSGLPYALSAEAVGPAKIENVRSVVMTSRGAVYFGGDSVGVVTPATAAKPPATPRPRGVTLDSTGNLVAVDSAQVLPIGGKPIFFSLPKPGGTPELFGKIAAVVQALNGDWLVMDETEKMIHRFTRTGAYVAPFASARVTRLATNEVDDVAGIDRDQKSLVIFDAAGKVLTRIPFKATGYDLQNPEDLAFDLYGHLYVLDRGAIAVFSPYGNAAPTTPAAAAGATTYRLLALYTEPEKATGAFRRAMAFSLDPSGNVYLYDDRVQRVLVYR